MLQYGIQKVQNVNLKCCENKENQKKLVPLAGRKIKNA
jgi:hypothetical protein